MKEVTSAFVFKLKLTPEQEVTLRAWSNTCRALYNYALEHRITSWDRSRKSESYQSQCLQLTECKKTEGLEWLKDVPSQVLQQTLKNLDRAFVNFFEQENVGFPNFKKKKQGIGLRFPSGSMYPIKRLNKNWATISLPKGMNLRFRLTKKITGTVNFVTIKFAQGSWWISINASYEREFNAAPQTEVGIDRGIKESLVMSDGKVFNLPSKAKKIQKRISAIQRKSKRQKLFSSNWRKTNRKIGKLHSQIKNIRKDFLQKTSTELANSHGLIRIEDLKIKNMSKSAKGSKEKPGKKVKAKSGLNREILFQGWGMFARMLSYKVSWRGGIVELVNPKWTSQTCSKCLVRHPENRKGKLFHCVNCGHKSDADLNAAKVIELTGVKRLYDSENTAGRAGSACGGVSVSSAVEARTSSKSRKTA